MSVGVYLKCDHPAGCRKIIGRRPEPPTGKRLPEDRGRRFSGIWIKEQIAALMWANGWHAEKRHASSFQEHFCPEHWQEKMKKSAAKKPAKPKLPRKQSSAKLSTLAARAIKDPLSLTAAEIKSLAASVLSQDETKKP